MEPGRPAGDDPDPGAARAPLRPRRGELAHRRDRHDPIPRRCKRRREVAELPEALLAKHPRETVRVAWDDASTHEDDEDDEVEAVLRGAAGRLVRLYLPTYSPWLNPIEMLRRRFRREVTHGELFASIDALLEATAAFCTRYNRRPDRVRSIIGVIPHDFRSCT